MKASILFCLLALAPLQGEEKPAPKAPATVPIVTVSGQVRAPGPVAYRKGLKLIEAIQTAEGITEFGAERRVRIIRKGKSKEYDLYDDKQKSVPVEEGDVIEVPQKNMCGIS